MTDFVKNIITEDERVRWNTIITDVLARFIAICKQNQLTYYCAGGTALGAVRHSGMIPWDDDIDVYMPRPDYDRFMSIASAMDMGDYELVTPYNKCDYPLYFAKLCNRHTTLQEEADTPCVYGLYIDIFPLDGAPDSEEEARRLVRRFVKTRNKLEAISTHSTFWEYIALLARPGEWGRFVRKAIGFFFRSQYRRRLLRQMEEIATRHDYSSSAFVAVYSGAYGEREVFPRAWLEGTAQFRFQGLTVDLPADYDAYLHHYFGNYMQLPPEEKRVSHHQHAYYNLDERKPDDFVHNVIRLRKCRQIRTIEAWIL